MPAFYFQATNTFLFCNPDLNHAKTIQSIPPNPKLTSRILSLGTLKAGTTSALESLLDHPAASFMIALLEDWQQSKNNESTTQNYQNAVS